MGVRFSKGYELRNKNNKGLLDLVCFSGRWLKRGWGTELDFFGVFQGPSFEIGFKENGDPLDKTPAFVGITRGPSPSMEFGDHVQPLPGSKVKV